MVIRVFRRVCPVLFCAGLLIVAVGTVPAQDSLLTHIGSSISYISGSTFYIGAGRQRGLVAGDTLVVLRGGRPAAKASISAVSGSSSAAQLITAGESVSVGDSVFIVKYLASPERTVTDNRATFGLRGQRIESEGPAVHGRVGVQFVGAGPTGGSWNFAQPSLLIRLQIGRLFGEGLSFSMYGRSTYDLVPISQRTPEGRRLDLRMYEMNLSYDNPASWYGMSLGRLNPRYIIGIGTVDGAQFTVRRGNLVAGVLGGSQPDYRTSYVDPERQKFAGFINVSWGSGDFGPGDITFAYGQQLYKGRLDRDFLYMQSTLTLGSRLYLYQSAEVDLHRLDNAGMRVHVLDLTNGFATLTFQATDWLNVNAGFDATQPISFLESMGPDTLLKKETQGGLRGGINIRLPWQIVLFGTASYRFKTASFGSAESFGGGFRLSDIGGTGFNAGAQYLKTRGLYTEGNDIAVNIDRWISGLASVSVRFDRYSYMWAGSDGTAVASTLSGNLMLTPWKSLYLMMGVDRVWDPTLGSVRVLAEVGVHF
jgi:hypothetical protein